MRVLFLSDLYFPFVGGAEEVCRMEAEELAKKGHDVFVVTSSMPNLNRYEEVHGVKIYRLDLRNIQLNESSTGLSWLIIGSVNHLLSYNPFSAQKVKKTIEKLEPEIIHVHNVGGEIPLIVLLSLRNLKCNLKAKIIMSLHDYRLICPRATLFCHVGIPCGVPRVGCNMFVRLQKIMLGDSTIQFVAPSKFLADRFKEKFGNAEITVIPNPIQKIDVKPKKSSDQFQILYIGRLVWYKGIRTLLEAFRILKNENVRLLVAGSGPELETVKRYSRVNHRIIPLGFISEGEKQRLLKNVNFITVPSLWPEPLSMLILESFGSGTPVIASKIGGNPEVIKDGVNGRLFEPGDSEELSKILAELAENYEEEFRKLQRGAAESAYKYQIDRHIELLENVYSEVTL
jgi:glycosyltransferase involved in cell wall biosynthesis